MTLNTYSLEKELQHYAKELRLKRINYEDFDAWGLCLVIACDDKTKEGCAFFSSDSYNDVWVTLYKDLVRGTLVKEIPLNTPGKRPDEIFIAISSFKHMLMTYRDMEITKLSIYAHKYEDDYDGCLIPRNELYILIE